MNDPERLFDGQTAEPLKAMIAAARAEQPDGAALQKALALTAVSGAATLLVAGRVAELSTAHISGLSLTALKWTGVGLIAGVTTLGVYELPELIAPPAAQTTLTEANAPAGQGRGQLAAPGTGDPITAPRQSPPAAPVAPAADAPPSGDPSRAPAPIAPEPLAPDSKRVAPNGAGAARVSGGPSDARPGVMPELPADPLVQEVLLLDAARAALRAGDLAAAQTRLNEHQTRFGGAGRSQRTATETAGKLVPEALYLKLEILERRGDHAGALKIARDLVSRFPDTPPATRARSLLERQIP